MSRVAIFGVMLLGALGCRRPDSAQSEAPPEPVAAPSQPAAEDAPATSEDTTPAQAEVRWDDAAIAALAREADPAAQREGLRELVRAVAEGQVQKETVYPHLGELREALRGASVDPSWQHKDRGGLSLGQKARELLALWHDPRDADLVARWLDERKDMAHAAPPGLSGATLQEALESWRDDHFTREGFPKRESRTGNWLRVIAEKDGHAIAEHFVRYAHWGYNMRLVLTTDDRGRWVVRIRMTTMWEHYD